MLVKAIKKQSSLQQTLAFVALATTILFIWSQVDSIERLFDQHKPIVIQYETDPASWPVQRKENEPTLRQASLFPASVFSRQNPQALPSVTAIINRVDKNHQGVIQMIEHLSRYPFIREIMVYNQLIERPLQIKNSSSSLDIPIQLIEAPLTNSSKFRACANATYDHCYFQDDLWFNTYLDSLYTHFIRYPEHFVVHTRPSNYIDYMTWRFKNQANLLHTGYADLRYGAFVSRQKVQRFLNQTETYGLDVHQLKYADVYFSIWLNQYPYMITNSLLSSGRDSFKQIDTVNNRRQVQHHMYQALTMLESGLMQNNSTKAFEDTSLMPVAKERDVRSSCSNDRCLFITNISSMPDIESEEHIEFNSSLIANLSFYEQAYQNYLMPMKADFIHQYEGKAVDSNAQTCWHIQSNPKTGDYFGLYMAGDIQAKSLTMYTPYQFKQPLDEVFEVTAQFVMYGSWENCTIELPHTQLDHHTGFRFACPYGQPIKSIRISFRQDLQEPFELCGLRIDNFVI